MATHSSILAWTIPWTEEPSRLESMGLQRVEHDCMTGQCTSAIVGHSGSFSLGHSSLFYVHSFIDHCTSYFNFPEICIKVYK